MIRCSFLFCTNEISITDFIVKNRRIIFNITTTINREILYELCNSIFCQINKIKSFHILTVGEQFDLSK